MAHTPLDYLDTEAVGRGVAAGEHRKIVGGLWNEVGRLQFDFLRGKGLVPSCRLLDIGCGSLRGGIWFADYLDARHYFGTDINQSLLDAGYDIELTARSLQSKVPRNNLVCNGTFDFARFCEKFDFALAQSLFTHLPAAELRSCLERLAPKMNAGGRFFSTFFLVPEFHTIEMPFDHPHGVRSFGNQNPFNYRRSQILDCCSNLPWSANFIGDWNHPRDQQMVEFSLLP